MLSGNSLFAQILQLISRPEFQESVRELKSDRGIKRFSSWDQFVSMLFCQLAQAKSLREICYGLRCCLGKLNHLGLKDDPKRSTLSYANKHRSSELFKRIFYQFLDKCFAISPVKKTKFQFRNLQKTFKS